MANLRTTVILKTDIVDSTPRLAGQTQSEMGLQRKQHKRFIADTATKYLGSILQEEGDAYWIEFPSVTTAVLAAIEMHQNLRSMQTSKSEKQRLAIRAIITVGDILHQERDTIGTTMSLTARIEKVTPPDEIYLSHAAWLVLNKAEVQTSFVNEFSFKGFHEPEKVYKVDQKHRTRVITNQYIIFTDLQGWSKYILAKSVEEIEGFLLDYDDLLNDICENNNGVIRAAMGDSYFLTFSDINQLLSAVEQLCEQWKAIFRRHKIGLKSGIHKGNLNIFRSYIYSQSQDIHITEYMTQLSRVTDKDGFSVTVTGLIRKASQGTRWERKFIELDKNTIRQEEILKRIVEEHGAYRFIASLDTFPPFDIHLSDLNQFILDLVEEYKAEKIRSWDDLEKRVKAFFTAKQIEHVESVVPGWSKMASFLDGVTLVHVIGVFLGLMVLPEFQYLSERQQEIAKWIVLFHDVEKEIRKGERDPKHAFRSAVTAARRLPHLGFAVTKEYDSLITSWSEFTYSAIKKPSDLPEPVQDNDKLPEILAGIEKMFGNDTPAALIVKGVLLHMSINVVEDWPQASPMTQAEIKRNVKRNLVPFLKVMMLADNEGWVMFYPDRVKQRNETLEAFERIEQIISG